MATKSGTTSLTPPTSTTSPSTSGSTRTSGLRSWDLETDTWTVRAEQGGADRTYRCRFLYCATGYYNYDHPYTPDFRGIENFTGEVVQPQHWPESLDYTGKRVVVIGSGATAISLIPALTEKAGHVTMLQRSPSYLWSSPQVDPLATVFRKLLPPRLAHFLIKWRFALFYVLTRPDFSTMPVASKWSMWSVTHVGAAARRWPCRGRRRGSGTAVDPTGCTAA